MAKGLEDTALYRCNRLIALNEVGSAPGRFGITLASSTRRTPTRLARCRARCSPPRPTTPSAARTPAPASPRSPRHAALWASDGRRVARHARRAGAADRPQRGVFLLSAAARRLAGGVAAGAEPPAAELERARRAGAGGDAEVGRARRGSTPAGCSATRATRRRSRRSSRARSTRAGNAFLASFRGFEAAVAPDGAANGLIQAALKLTVPGVPDIYQGAESGSRAWSIPTTAGRSISPPAPRCWRRLGDGERPAWHRRRRSSR